MAKLTGQDVSQHNNKDSCWVIVHGKAYDVTEFLPGMFILDFLKNQLSID
jgi:cytochrome b involved in lipid metabolism